PMTARKKCIIMHSISRTDVLDIWVCNDTEKRQKPKKPSEIKKEECMGRLQFIFPNYWQNIIGDKIRVMAAFIPSNDDTTILYIRVYQKFLKIPLLKSLVNLLLMKFNKIVLNQDENIVTSQIPKISDVRNKDLLVQADIPVAMFRKYMYEESKADRTQEAIE
ncbi:MAG: hypothetical protein ACP5UV_04715, partial [Thermoplasmata archaeon]